VSGADGEWGGRSAVGAVVAVALKRFPTTSLSGGEVSGTCCFIT